MPYSPRSSTSAGRASRTAWAAAWGPLCLPPPPCDHTPLPLLTDTSFPPCTPTTRLCPRSICPARPKALGPARRSPCGSPLWSSRALQTPTLFLCHMSSWASLTSPVFKLCQTGCTPPTHKVHSRGQQRVVDGDRSVMLGRSLLCQDLQQDDGPVTWHNWLKMNSRCGPKCWRAANCPAAVHARLYYCLFMLLLPGGTCTRLSNDGAKAGEGQMLEKWLLKSLSVFTKGARSLSVTNVVAFYLFNFRLFVRSRGIC